MLLHCSATRSDWMTSAASAGARETLIFCSARATAWPPASSPTAMRRCGAGESPKSICADHGARSIVVARRSSSRSSTFATFPFTARCTGCIPAVRPRKSERKTSWFMPRERRLHDSDVASPPTALQLDDEAQRLLDVLAQGLEIVGAGRTVDDAVVAR